jgi:hypothetical protein
MKLTLRFPILVVFATAGVVFLAGERSSSAGKEREKEVDKIPLKSIYSTNGQKGLIAVKQALEKPSGKQLNILRRDFPGGASNVVMVRGKNLTAALLATRWAFTGSRSADVAIDPDDGSKDAPLWMVAYLGNAGSSPPYWLIGAMERKGKTVRLKFAKDKSMGGRTKDSHHYFIWVPLGKLGAGTYNLELYDEDKEQVILLRRVTVSAKQKR